MIAATINGAAPVSLAAFPCPCPGGGARMSRAQAQRRAGPSYVGCSGDGAIIWRGWQMARGVRVGSIHVDSRRPDPRREVAEVGKCDPGVGDYSGVNPP